MSVQALIADLLPPASPPPRASKATVTPGEWGEKGENPRPVWSGEGANKGESRAKRGESSHAPAASPPQFAQKSPQFAPDSPAFAPPRNRTIAEDSPNSPLSPRVQGALHSPDKAQSAIEELERLHEETGRMIESALRDAKIRANAEAIGNALESSLIEGAEALAKTRPAQARYPGASLTPEPDRPARPIAPATLAVIHAWLDHIGEDDAQTRQEFVEGLARDPEQLRLRIEDAIAAGLAEWDRPQVETDEPADSITSKAVCARCTHWTPDRINPPGGLGRCTIAAPASKRPGSLWPWLDAEIHCTRFQEITSC